jgi:phage terminase small subunit
MPRGPKQKTSRNSHKTRPGIIRHETFEPPSPLTKEARTEYDRLLAVLGAKGTLDRVDLAVVAECSRINALLDRAHALAEKLVERDAIKMIGLLTSQRRGLLRELGLTTQPSRNLVKHSPAPTDKADDPIAARIKLA